MVEYDIHTLECLIEMAVIPFTEVPWADTLLLCGNNDRCAMVVRTTYKNDLFTGMSHEPDIGIRRDIGPEMTEVTWSVRIRKPTGDEKRLTVHQYLFSSRLL
jgi:hypothetical protein